MSPLPPTATLASLVMHARLVTLAITITLVAHETLATLAPAGRRGAVDPERFWATLLMCNALEIMEFSWLADEEENLTIVDLGNLWVEKQARRPLQTAAKALHTAR